MKRTERPSPVRDSLDRAREICAEKRLVLNVAHRAYVQHPTMARAELYRSAEEDEIAATTAFNRAHAAWLGEQGVGVVR